MHPILIVGVALAGLPVVLHLIMKQEPKRLPFPALRFLKVKQRTNQRKLRLRHFLLLLLRVLLIALFAATLYQPTVRSEGVFLGGEQPVAAVFVLDTTPSMGYTVNDRTRLDDARKLALDVLAELPDGSKAAVVDPADATAPGWEPSLAAARRRIEGFTQPLGGGPPVSTGLAAAYQLLRQVDAEADGPDVAPLPRLVAVFSDRTAACWDAARADDLAKLRDAVPEPRVTHLFADVGADQPTDVALLAADSRPQSVPQNQPVTVAVTVQAAGVAVPSTVVRARVDGGTPERREVSLAPGTPRLETFSFAGLKPEFHHVEVALETADRLAFNNVRHVTVRVGQARKVLTIADDPADADFWKLALDAKGDFQCDVKTPADAGSFAGYEAVCLLGVADPNRPLAGGPSLWAKLADYLNRGGKAVIVPGPTPAAGAYDAATGPAADVLPGRLARVLDAPADRPGGAAWAVDAAALRHPLIAPFRDWRQQNVDFLKTPRRAWKYWAADAPAGRVVVSYDDDADPARRHPAVLERTFDKGGKAFLLTVRMDPMTAAQEWHDYWKTGESTWGVVFPNLLVRTLTGDAADASFNFPTGQAVTVPLPAGDGSPRTLVFEGPGVSGPDATPKVAAEQTTFRLPAARTLTAGNYALRSEDRAWQEAFSLNAPADESDLAKVPVEAIEAVCGSGSVVPAGKPLDFLDRIDKFNRPLDLFPWLLVAVLVLFAGEGLLSNRFYRSRPAG